MAVTIRTPYIPGREIRESAEFTTRYGIKHKILDISFPFEIKNNPPDRCYLCKKTLFSELLRFKSDNNYRHIMDGSNADDSGTHRPGMKALREMGIRSPLLEAGITKKDIRELSRNEGLDIWDKPAMACLLTRIPYNTEVTGETLKMIDQAENILFEMGFHGVRVRIHGDLARIECIPGYMERIIHNPERENIIGSLKKLGFRYVSLDLEGYRSGSSDILPGDFQI